MFTKQNCSAIAQELLQRSLDMLLLANDKTMLLHRRSPYKLDKIKLVSNYSRVPAEEPRYVHDYSMQNHAPPEEPIRVYQTKLFSNFSKTPAEEPGHGLAYT